jgi:uncharacterized RDD family membrane protein YckC
MLPENKANSNPGLKVAPHLEPNSDRQQQFMDRQPVPASLSNAKYAGLWRRIAASVIDELILLSLQCLPCLGVVFTCYLLQHCCPVEAQKILPDIDSSEGVTRLLCIILPLALFVYFVIPWLYVAVYESSAMQATPGKRMLNLKVTGTCGERISFCRASFKLAVQSVLLLCFVTMPSAVIFILAALDGHPISFNLLCVMLTVPVFVTCFGLVLFTNGRQTLFDKLCGRLVLFERRELSMLKDNGVRFSTCTLVAAVLGGSLMSFLNINQGELGFLPANTRGWVRNTSGEVLRASKDLEEGHYVRSADLGQDKIATFMTPLYAVSSPQNACGHLTKRRIRSGEIISYADLWPHSFEVKSILSDRPLVPSEDSYNKKLLRDCDRYIARGRLPEIEGYTGRAWVHNQGGRYAKAVQDCNQALKIDSNYKTAYLTRADAFIRLHRFQKALADCNKVIEINADCSDAYVLRASVYEKLGKGRLARADRQIAQKLDAE